MMNLQLFKNRLKLNCTFVAKSDFATLTLWNDEEYGFKDLKFSIKNIFLVKDRKKIVYDQIMFAFDSEIFLYFLYCSRVCMNMILPKHYNIVFFDTCHSHFNQQKLISLHCIKLWQIAHNTNTIYSIRLIISIYFNQLIKRR